MSNQFEIHLAPREECTGCAACASACPKGCISMEADGEGFSRPAVREGCTGCGACRAACPVFAAVQPPKEPAVFAAWNKDRAVRRRSASGGVFPILAEDVLARGGAVYGAAFDGTFRLVHICVTSPGELSRLQGAKYVQSDLSGVYPKVRSQLKQGRTVLFSGTPCQVAGLYQYLKEPYDTLITCDLVCHGVPSPEVWKRYKEELERGKGPLQSVSFRDKRDGWSRARFLAEYEDQSADSAPLAKTPYGRGFGMALFLRPSCYRCRYAAPGRRADFTLGDFWGVDRKALPRDVSPEEGISLALLHSRKSRTLFEAQKDKCGFVKRPFSEAAAGNPRLLRPVEQPKDREAFFRDFEALPWEEVRKKWLSIPSLPYRAAAKILSPGLKRKLRGILGK
ncbi:MAG: Coenzyme F420 hydrogenase/dehydrogenase, beta subunit C-terminal domain [Oscillospiraceae bacterium]|nr:Coenzyme F420 hydrogenase/dehydrogenase, beta subunit C-terminal domain [Oscillospiraceae bacterium]